MGGADISVQRAAEGLAKAGHEVLVITTSPTRRCYKEEINDVSVYRLGRVNIYPYPPYKSQKKPRMLRLLYYIIDLWNPFSYAVVRNILKREKPDIVNINNFEGLSVSVFSAVKSLNLPLIFTIRDLAIIGIKDNPVNLFGRVDKTDSRIRRLYDRILRHIINNKPNTIIVISQFVNNALKRYGFFSDTGVVVVLNAIEIDNLQCMEKNYDTIDILYVGALDRIKGVHILIEAFKKLKAENVRLHVIGKGKDEERFKLLAGSDRRITFYGFKSGKELMDFYKKANLLVAPSLRFEAFGRIIIESFNYGTPVVGSNTGAYPELIKSGYNGFLFEAGNIGELRDILNNLIENPSELMRLEKGAFKSRNEYDIEKHIKRLEELYQRIQ